MDDAPSTTVTALLARLRDGDRESADALFEIVYSRLRRDAAGILRHAGPITLQPTALVHEAWLRLMPGGPQQDFRDRVHFVRVAARAMRSVLVDHARARDADKRGGGRQRVDFDALVSVYESGAVDLVELDDALARLGEIDAQLAQVVELRFFGGLEIDEVAAALGVSASTVDRAWRTARTWLRAELDASA